MTPPDAMSWDEAVAVLEAATPEIVGRAERAEHKRALAAIQSHRVQADLMANALKAVKIRLHFDGMPGESMWNAGTDDSPRWTSDWRHEIALIEQALHGTPYTPPSALEKVRRRCEVSVQAEADAVDARRYRWLAEQTELAWTVSRYAREGGVFQHIGKRNLDAAIDAALAAAANNDGGGK